MAVEWIIPLAKEAYANRNAAMSAWDKLVTMVLGPKYKIAFVGPGGIGKSVLLDHVSGKALKSGYSVPGVSRKAEFGSAKVEGSRVAIVVSPGQKSGPQIETYNEAFNEDDPVDGVVFVVGSGLVTLRDQSAKEAMIARGINSLERWREHNLEVELEALKELCSIVRSTKQKSRKPKWIIVAITKIDLLYSEIGEIKNYYSPYANSDFSALLNALQDTVGHDNLQWEAVPVCSHLENFTWAGETLNSTLGPDERDHLLGQFINQLEGFCR